MKGRRGRREKRSSSLSVFSLSKMEKWREGKEGKRKGESENENLLMSKNEKCYDIVFLADCIFSDWEMPKNGDSFAKSNAKMLKMFCF
ncbi:MAG: hypothetical protein NC489_22285 [Ruminococcus flavefaciens]|nr:hypothetical protein [Ruminococcus flavefaciens]